MRHRNIILLAAVLSLAAVLVAAGPALGENATAVPSPGPGPQDTAPTAMPTPTMKVAGAATTGDVVSGDYVAKVIDNGLIAKTVSPGGTITGYAVIRNTGKDMIKDALVHLDVMKARENAHAIKVTTLDQPLSNLYIAPGDQKRAEFSINLPGSVKAGDYTLQATVEANGQQIDTFTQPVTVT